MPTSNDNIPEELRSAIEDLQRRVEALEKKVSELTGGAPSEDNPAKEEEPEEKPIDLDEAIDLDIDESPSGGILSEPEPEEPVHESEPAPAESEVTEDIPEAEPVEPAQGEQHISTLFGEIVQEKPERKKHGRKSTQSINEANEGKGKAVMDVMAEKNAWLSDIPGPEVKSLRSAIGLGDQILFINRLFRSDAALYQSTVEKLNGMKTLKEAVTYISETFPEWDVESEDVYRFMMAVRRKIRR